MGEVVIGRHGAFSRADAIAEFGRYRVRRAQESGEWLSPWPGVLVEGKRASDPLTIASAALVLGGPKVMLAGPTAAHLHGCTAVPMTPVHLIAPYCHWLRSRPGIVVHNGPMSDDDRTDVLDLPVLGLERVITDLLCTAQPPDALAVTDQALALLEPAQRERFREAITERLVRRSDPRGARRGETLLAFATGRAESPAESWLLCRIVDSGFPPPDVNWSLEGPDGREIYRLDLSWPELRIVVEYYGYAVHAERTAEDEARADDLRRRGWIVLVVRASDLRDPGPFERRLDDAFHKRGVDTSRRSVGLLRGRRHREPREHRRGA
jgi:hypothetical protein